MRFDRVRPDIDRLVRLVLDAVDPYQRTRTTIGFWRHLGLGDAPFVIAIGKAAAAMVQGAVEAAPRAHGLIYGPAAVEIDGFECFVGTHPFPSVDAATHGQRALEEAARLGAEDQALVLVSGGGSSLFEVPRIPVAELVATTRSLMHAGADIATINAFRVGMSEVKGGRLANALAPAAVFTAILSDVPTSAHHDVASGPTLRHPATEPPALLHTVAPDVAARWQAPPRDVAPGKTAILADNATAIGAIEAEHPSLRQVAALQGEARDAGARFFEAALETRHGAIAGGETTVVVRGKGRGGRNQELVLGAFEAFEARAPKGAVLCAFGTDGIDGASDNAGAYLDHDVIRRARELGLDPRAALEDNDSATFFEAIDAHIRTGPTGTNVADIVFMLL